MSRPDKKTGLLLLLVAVTAAAGGYALAQWRGGAGPSPAASVAEGPAKALYWYDPMYPQQKFDRPGKSPFMDMQLVPRYASGSADETTVSVDPRVAQNLGLRLAPVTRGALAASLEVSGIVAYNQRDVAVIQARVPGYVERVYGRAPGDLLKAGAPLADILVPEWVAAQEEFLALRRLGDPGLLTAARQRLRLSGMPAGLIAQVERSGRVQPVLTVTTPIAGVLQTLEVRAGMTLALGQSLARVNGLGSVWLEVAVPEAQAAGIAAGQPVQVQLAIFPGRSLHARVDAVLPEVAADSRTVSLRVELPNPDGQLHPGLSAQVRIDLASERPLLSVPSEALIRTGRRSLVMLATDAGHYQPVEVLAGAQSAGRTAILQGLEEGQQVVASGPFLLDSEASLKGLVATPLAVQERHEATAQVVWINEREVRLAHGPFTTLGMPGMTMNFLLAAPGLGQGLKPGDRVRVVVRQTDEGLRVEQLQKTGGRP